MFKNGPKRELNEWVEDDYRYLEARSTVILGNERRGILLVFYSIGARRVWTLAEWGFRSWTVNGQWWTELMSRPCRVCREGVEIKSEVGWGTADGRFQSTCHGLDVRIGCLSGQRGSIVVVRALL